MSQARAAFPVRRLELDTSMSALEPLVLDNLPLQAAGPYIEVSYADQMFTFSWGQAHQIGAAAYWTYLTRCVAPSTSHSLGSDLRTELVACMLGGYGIPAEVGLAAFRRLQSRGVLEGVAPSSAQLEALLDKPLKVGAKGVVYRFWRQRASRIAHALAAFDRGSFSEVSDPRDLRDHLIALPGVGPKTASWVVRNQTGSSDVAIIDIHITRAGLAAGFFSPRWGLPHDYLRFERAFIGVAMLGGVRAADMDACMWSRMRRRRDLQA